MPMLYTRFTSQNMVGHTFILVPKSAPQLLEALREIAKEESASGNPVSVIASNAVDTITCYRHFTAIPAFNLNWTPQAELVYESALLQHSHEELHSSETHNGIPWQVYPNLQPMSTRGSTLFGCSNPRETELTQQAEGLFQWALKIPGMTRYESHGDIRYYSIALLPQAYRPDESLFIRLYREPPVFIPDIREEIKRSAAAIADGLFLPNLTTDENLLDALAAQGIPCEYRSLNIAPLLTYYPANEAPNDWPETVAATMLRKLPSILPALEGTLMVLDALYSRKRSSL